MPLSIHLIKLPLPLGMGAVNCYLLQNGSSYFLVDSGGSNARRALRNELARAGCTPGSLKLLILTHGDFDHTGNAAYLRAELGARIAMHRDDRGMVEDGDMFVNRKKPNRLLRSLIPILTGFGRAERFTPDRLLEDGDDLAQQGMEARVVCLPGHSRGSIGILTNKGELFCGDLLENTQRPAVGSLMDDPLAAKTSLARLDGLGIRMVYPGHGQPFALEALEVGQL